MISFHCKHSQYRPANKSRITEWLNKSVQHQKKSIGNISIVFCSDEYLLQINKQYLNHNYFTDIITFDYSTDRKVSGDLFVSVDRLRDNSKQLEITLQLEVRRVLVHGVLHLCGYNDKSTADKKLMTAKEDFYLARY